MTKKHAKLPSMIFFRVNQEWMQFQERLFCQNGFVSFSEKGCSLKGEYLLYLKCLPSEKGSTLKGKNLFPFLK